MAFYLQTEQVWSRTKPYHGSRTSVSPPVLPAHGILGLDSCLRTGICRMQSELHLLKPARLQEVLPQLNPSGTMCPEVSIQLEGARHALGRQLGRLAAEPPMSGTW